MLTQCRSREGCFRMYPVAGGRISQLDGRKGVSTKAALETQDTTRKAGPVYDIPHGYRQMGLETRFRCSRVSEGREHLTDVNGSLAAAGLDWALASNILLCAAIAAGNHSSRRHFGLGRRPFAIARRSIYMAFSQGMWHAPCDRSAEVRARGQ